MTRREVLGLILIGALVGTGRLVRRWLLVGPDGRWRDPLWLDELVPESPVEEIAPPPPEPPFRINSTTVDTLVHLPGVGPVLAKRIVVSRELEGPFHGPQDLRRVKGIGPRLSARMGPLLDFAIGATTEARKRSTSRDTCR